MYFNKEPLGCNTLNRSNGNLANAGILDFMKKIIVLLVLFQCLALSAEARCRGKDILNRMDPVFLSSLQKATDSHPCAVGRYWEITKDGKTSWVIGTAHLDDRRIKRVPRFFSKKIRKARVVQVEATPAQMHEYLRFKEKQKQANIKKALRNSGKPTRSYFSTEEWKDIARVVKQKGIDLELLNRLSAGAVATLLQKPPCETKAKTFLDIEIMTQALKSKVPLIGLDEIGQIKKDYSTGNRSKSFYINLAKLNLARQKNAANFAETRIQMYRRGEIMKIWEFEKALLRRMTQNKAILRALSDGFNKTIVKRNKKWLPKIRSQIDKGNVVIAVGALHLPGKNGLLYLLKRKGYQIKRLGI